MFIDLFTINKIFVVLIDITAVSLGFWVYLNNPGQKINRVFVAMVFLMMLWVNFAYFARSVGGSNLQLVLFYLKIAWFATPLFFILLYILALHLFNKNFKYKFIDLFLAFLAILTSFIVLFTNYIVKGVGFKGVFLVRLIYGEWMFPFLIVISLFIAVTLYVLFKKYYSGSGKDKRKILYYLFGIIVFYIANIIFNIILPVVFNITRYYFLGDYSTIVLLSFTAYAIVKHKLMGIKIFLAQILAIIISIILLVDIFFLANNLTMQILKLGILFAFLYFGKEMVANAKKEKEDKESLEKINIHLEEKTRDLSSLLSLSEISSASIEIENSVKHIINAVPEKLGYLGIMGTFLIRYEERRNKAYFYIVSDAEQMQQVKSLLSKQSSDRYCLTFDTKNPKKYGLIIKSILNNEIKKGAKLENFIYPEVNSSTASLIQKKLRGKSFLSIPMLVRGKRKGALLFIFTKSAKNINRRDIDLTKAITQNVSVIIDNLTFYRHLNKTIRELTRAKDNLKETLSMKNDFLHIVSHQLRTPLTVMRGFISMWGEGDFDKFTATKMKEIRKKIVNNSERLNNIVNSMVLAMESVGEMKLEVKSVDVRDLLTGDIEMLKSNFEKKKLYLRYKVVSKNIPKIMADGKLLLNVFMNLIDNAEKYTNKGGLTVEVKQKNKNVIISFIDTGIGLSKSDKKILFKKFSRGEKSNYINPNGSGLGLFIIKQIISRHHGTIKAISKGEGKGSTFEVTLPIKQ